MTAPEVPWQIEPHTLAKHALYREYLGKWIPIMVQGAWKGDMTYAEGFAGPGVYKDGSPGSPVIALRALLDRQQLRGRFPAARFLFVDLDPRCTKLLEQTLQAAANAVPLDQLAQHNIHVAVRTGPCEPNLVELLTEQGAWGRPMLVVLDTWGGAVPADLVKRVAANPSSEVVITIQPQYFSRFAGAEQVVHGDRVFGHTAWREVAGLPADQKARWVLQRYRETLTDAGFTHVLDFELIDSRGQALYLVFGTSHDQGLRKMKEAMWDVDDVAGVGYRDPRDPDQQTLAIELEPQTAPLRRLLRDYLTAQPDRAATVVDLRAFAFYRTVYKESQVPPLVRQMVEEGELVLSDGGSFGWTRRVGLPG